MAAVPRIGGAPACVLRAGPPDVRQPAFVDATVLPGRGMMLLQARLRLPSGELLDALAAPDLDAAARLLDGDAEDFAGNRSFSFGGAILAPFANRIRGRPLEDARAIETLVAGRPARLPRNWGGRAPGAEQYAMHGLLLSARARLRRVGTSSVEGRLDLDDAAGWPGRLRFEVVWALEGGGLTLAVTAVNTGPAATPVGIGWHPYFRLASGDRAGARLRVAARTRVRVNNYDEVLPTGDLEAVAGGPYDFAAPQGRARAGFRAAGSPVRGDRAAIQPRGSIWDAMGATRQRHGVAARRRRHDLPGPRRAVRALVGRPTQEQRSRQAVSDPPAYEDYGEPSPERLRLPDPSDGRGVALGDVPARRRGRRQRDRREQTRRGGLHHPGPDTRIPARRRCLGRRRPRSTTPLRGPGGPWAHAPRCGRGTPRR